MLKIAFVTEELAVYGKSGGIGAAMYELAVMLANNGHEVDIHYIPIERPSPDRQKFIVDAFADRSIRLEFVDAGIYCWQEGEASNRAYAVYHHLKARKKHYDFLHVHDYKGLGFFCCAAKHQGLAFQDTFIVVQLHGPTRWTTHANSGLFTNQDQLKIDFLERCSIARADYAVSPSAYLLEWMGKNNFQLPPPSCVHVIKNVFSHCAKINGGTPPSENRFRVKEIILFGRHEARKGFTTFCDALDIISEKLAEKDVSICLMGGLGEINSQPSGIYLSERAKNWPFAFEFRVGFDRNDAMTFLRSREGAIVVIPSSEENSPYTVVEAIAAGRAVVTSTAGGAKELIDQDYHDEALVEMEPESLAKHLVCLIENGALVTHFAETTTKVEGQWLAFHNQSSSPPLVSKLAETNSPKVVVGITHFERPRKVISAIMSVMRQTYENIELVVVDDGSSSVETLEALPQIRKLVERVGGRFIRRENGYLGAARNTVARATQSDYLLFLDDDDLLFPDAVQRLVEVGTKTGADIVNCLNIYLDASVRGQYELMPETFEGKVSYVPLGGPLALAHLANIFGAATALIKRSFFDDLGGYTEIKRVGYEDYEFYARASQLKAHIEILPEPLYLYEVGKPSMISRTSRLTNKQRVIEALNIGLNPEAWRDAVELAAGSEAMIDTQNYNAWITSISTHRELLQRISETRNSIENHLGALREYAHEIGAPQVAAAWGAALQGPIRAQEENKRRVRTFRRAFVKNGGPTLSQTDEVALTSELAALVKLGKTGEAIEIMSTTLTRSGQVSEAVIEFIHLIAVNGGTDTHLVKELSERIADCFVDESLALRLQGAVASLLVSANLLNEAKSILSEIEAYEADEYIANYPDLEQTFGNDAAKRALNHYQKHGQPEGREGFKILRRVAQDVSRRIGRPINLLQLRHELDRSMKQSKASFLSLFRT